MLILLKISENFRSLTTDKWTFRKFFRKVVTVTEVAFNNTKATSKFQMVWLKNTRKRRIEHARYREWQIKRTTRAYRRWLAAAKSRQAFEKHLNRRTRWVPKWTPKWKWKGMKKQRGKFIRKINPNNYRQLFYQDYKWWK